MLASPNDLQARRMESASVLAHGEWCRLLATPTTMEHTANCFATTCLAMHAPGTPRMLHGQHRAPQLTSSGPSCFKKSMAWACAAANQQA